MRLFETGVIPTASCRNVKLIRKEAGRVKEKYCVEVFLRDNIVLFLDCVL
jgi:hypothetical protein